ncbi:hypothetical protein C8Q74DRAFT_1221481 [Fomes fomentarius]|nr:hypothetical protein C8Q74DRAFT_1221481 [Fomes fomentarius]
MSSYAGTPHIENTQWKLNFDVLLRIMHFATQDVVASLMRTCRPLNNEGAKHLFRTPVTLRTTVQVTSFLHFFLAQDERERERPTFRYSLLSELRISIDDPEELATSALKYFFACIAPHMRNFARLVLCHPEALLHADREIVDAIAALTSLKSMKVTKAGELCYAMLEKLCSPLLHAEVSMDSLIPGTTWRQNPVYLFRKSHRTLRSLEVRARTSTQPFGRDPFPGRTDPFYYILSRLDILPHLRRLSLNFALPMHPVTRGLIRHFPNLSHLHVSHCHVKVGSWRYMEGYRGLQSGMLQPDDAPWPFLHSYTGSWNALYMLGLLCPISRIDLWDDRPPSPVHTLMPALSDAKPSHLALTTRWGGASCWISPDFVDALSQPDFWRWPLKSFEITIPCRLGDENVVLEDVLKNILRIVGLTEVQAFRLTIDVSRITSEPDYCLVDNAWDDGYPPYEEEQRLDPKLSPVEQVLETLDIDAVVDQILESCPSLETAIFAIEGHLTRGTVRRQKGPDIMEEDESEGEGYPPP